MKIKKVAECVSNSVYILAAVVLSLISFTMIFKAGYSVVSIIITRSFTPDDILNSVSLIVIAIAVFDVGKYLIEEEVIRENELREPNEARQTLTKFMVIISISLALEALVYVFTAGKKDLSLLVYPSLLLFAVVAIIVGLGYYQKLSIYTEEKAEKLPNKDDG